MTEEKEMTAIEIFFQMMEDYEQLQQACKPIYEKYPGKHAYRDPQKQPGFDSNLAWEIDQLISDWWKKMGNLQGKLYMKKGKIDGL